MQMMSVETPASKRADTSHLEKSSPKQQSLMKSGSTTERLKRSVLHVTSTITRLPQLSPDVWLRDRLSPSLEARSSERSERFKPVVRFHSTPRFEPMCLAPISIKKKTEIASDSQNRIALQPILKPNQGRRSKPAIEHGARFLIFPWQPK